MRRSAARWVHDPWARTPGATTSLPGLGAFMCLLLLLPAAAAAEPAGSGPDPEAGSSPAAGAATGTTTEAGARIENRAEVAWRDAEGRRLRLGSEPSVVVVGQVAALALFPSRDVVAEPGDSIVLSHTLDNGGNGQDCATLSAESTSGFAVSFHRAAPGDGSGGTPSPGREFDGCVQLAAGESLEIVAVVRLPDTPEIRDQTHAVTVTATSGADPSATAGVEDRIVVPPPPVELSLATRVDRDRATLYDTLRYEIVLQASGTGTSTDVAVTDTLPEPLGYVDGSLRLDGTPLSDGADADPGRFDADAGVVTLALGGLPAGETRRLVFLGRVEAAAGDSVANRAVVTFDRDGERRRRVSTPAVTRLEAAELRLAKRLRSGERAGIGDDVDYELRLGNASDVATARSVSLVDSLPEGLVFVAADPPADVEGRVVRWTLGDLPPGDSTTVRLTTRVSGELADSSRVVNDAILRAENGGASGASARGVQLVTLRGDELSVELSADRLEAAMGETVGYTVALGNTGSLAIGDLVLEASLPAGVTFTGRGVTGVDSLRRAGRSLRLHVSGPLRPGARHVVRYQLAVVSPRAAILRHSVSARAEGGVVRAGPSEALVRVGRRWPMESRTAVGRVWVDLDRDGRFGAGDRGVEDVEVWTADGEVVVSDADGKISFRDLRPGGHAFRLDEATLPEGYRLAPGEEGLVTLTADGWTSPRLGFRLVPEEAPRSGSRSGAEGSGSERPVDGRPSVPEGSVPGGPVDGTGATAGGTSSPEPPTIPALRAPEEREAERQRAFLAGPAVTVFQPHDGAVLRRNRVYVGVRGEPRAPVALFDGDSLVAETRLRIDGVHDFVAVPLEPGPHRLRVRMRNSWNQARWDSLSVHVSGRPASFRFEGDEVRLAADGRSVETVRVRVLDRWGVPVAGRPRITVAAEGAEAVGSDVDASSMGLQLRPDAAGWLTVPLRPGTETGRGTLHLRAGDVRGRTPLVLMPRIRPFTVTGYGRVGLGASPDAFASITARGHLDERTSLALSYDSRRLDAGLDALGRTYDPLEASRYPIFGDASSRRSLAASRTRFSGRVKRGLDWVEVGDVATDSFTAGLDLTRYRRSVSGAAARVTTGAVTWRAFGTLTSQTLQQQQIRGRGSSGPYRIQPGLLPGSERVVVETRDPSNAARTVDRQPLERFVDYQIDYEQGVVLLKRPVPATDLHGNPVFLVVTYEGDGGGDADPVGGLRARVDLREAAGIEGVDSLSVGVAGIRGGGGSAGDPMLGGLDIRARTGDVAVGAELSYASVTDSSGLAAEVDGRIELLDDRLELDGSWTRVGARYLNPSHRALRAGTEELEIGAAWRVSSASTVRLEHTRQRFGVEDVERDQTALQLEQRLAPDVRLRLDVAGETFRNGAVDDRSVGGDMELSWEVTPELTLLAEGRRQFASSGRVARPDFLGLGADYRVLPGVTVETRHRQVFLAGDSASYSVSEVGVRSDLGFGTSVHGSYQLAGGADAAHNAAVLGVNNRVSLLDGLTADLFLERRVGLDKAPIEDPARTLPFLQVEEDYLSGGFGLELLPSDAPYRLTLRSELRDGDEQSTERVTMAAELSLDRSLAILSRQEFHETDRVAASLPDHSRRRSSLWGLAYRPVDGDGINALAKLEWRDETNPLGGGVLTERGEESRLLGIMEVIWSPVERWELGGRFALRGTRADPALGRTVGTGPEPTARRSRADYIGARTRFEVSELVALAAHARLLHEHTTDAVRWDLVPTAVLHPLDLVEIEAGYRFGDLRDPDFSVRGGHGFFLTFGARVTEHTVDSAAAFWRRRF